MAKITEAEYNDIFSPETMASLKGKSGESLRQMLGNKTLMQTMMRSQELLDQIADAESGYEDILADIAITMVKEAYPVIEYAGVEIQATINSNIEITSNPDKEDEEEEEEQPDVPAINAPENTKRRVINAITQGSSIRGAFGYLLFREYLDHVDDTLVDKYNEILKLSFGIYDDENAIAMMLAMLAQNQKIAGGESETEYNEEEDKFIIKAKALNFPMLVHEIVKGLYEILALQGFSGNKADNQNIVKQVDKVGNEPEDLRWGKFIYDAIIKLWQDGGYDDTRVRELLFTEIYKLEQDEFIPFVENAINGTLTTQQIQWAELHMDAIDRDLKKDDTGLDGLDGGEYDDEDPDEEHYA